MQCHSPVVFCLFFFVLIEIKSGKIYSQTACINNALFYVVMAVKMLKIDVFQFNTYLISRRKNVSLERGICWRSGHSIILFFGKKELHAPTVAVGLRNI